MERRVQEQQDNDEDEGYGNLNGQTYKDGGVARPIKKQQFIE
jgi:hypothetical protein